MTRFVILVYIRNKSENYEEQFKRRLTRQQRIHLCTHFMSFIDGRHVFITLLSKVTCPSVCPYVCHTSMLCQRLNNYRWN